MVPLSQSSETQEQMEASLTDENGNDRIKRFLRVYRPLECFCCNTVVAFQHKVTGAYFCAFRQNLDALSECHLKQMQGSGMEAPAPCEKPLMKAGVNNAIQAQNLLMANAASEGKNYQAVTGALSGLKIEESTVPKLVTPPHRASVDAVDGALSVSFIPMQVQKLKQAAAPQPAPQTVTVPLTKAKPAAVPVTAPPAKRYLWPECTYSSKLTNKARVMVPFAWNATTFLVYAMNDETGMENLQAKLKEHATTGKAMKTLPLVGEIVVAAYDGEYYRGRVTKVDGEVCKVAFVDYGDQVTCKYTEVFPVDDKIMAYPIYGLTVHLENLPADPKGVDLPQSLYDIATSNIFQLELGQQEPTNPSDAPVEAKLLDCGDGLSLNETIQKALWPTSVAAPPAPEPKKKTATASTPGVYLWSNCRYSPSFKNNAAVFVQYQYSPIIYHLAAEADIENLETFQGILAEFAEKAKPLNAPPVRDQIVIGNFEEQFYRARVEKIESEDTCRVVFVDYGAKQSYKFSELLQVDESIMQRPIYGIVAQLDKVPKAASGASYKYGEQLEKALNERMTLDVCSKDQLVPAEKSYIVSVRLYDETRDFCVNEAMTKALQAGPQ